MAITAKEAIAAIKDSKGFVTTIAKRLGCTRGNVYALMKKYPSVRDAIEEEREGNKDFAEAKLFEQIKAGNITGIIFYLKTQGRNRGYIEKSQVEIVQKELQAFLDLIEKELPPEVSELVLNVLAESGR